jgi:hypothetical protein
MRFEGDNEWRKDSIILEDVLMIFFKELRGIHMEGMRKII